MVYTLADIKLMDEQPRGSRETDDRVMRYDLPSDPQAVRPVVEAVRDKLADVGVCETGDLDLVCLAIEEGLVNAIVHGNLEIGTVEEPLEQQEIQTLVDRRRQQRPYRDRTIRFEARLDPGRAEFVIQDQGRGFDPREVPDPTQPANLTRSTGRGLLIMRSVMDKVIVCKPGTTVIMVKEAA